MSTIFSNICKTNEQALYAIQELHNNGQPFHLDPMFNRGSMYGTSGQVFRPLVLFDLIPLHEDVAQGNARSLPLPDSSIHSAVLDPPWLINSGKATAMTSRYSCLKTRDELMLLIQDLLKEAYRYLQTDGLLVFKCQDFTHNRRKFFMSHFIIANALVLKFNLIDEFISAPGSRFRKPVHDINSVHSSHSMFCKFLVFRKRQSRTNY